VANETNGTWGTAVEVPGTATLNTGTAQVNSVSCASAGSCTIGGLYQDSAGSFQAFVDTETSGTWGTAQELSGTPTLNAGGFAGVNTVSCASAGNCAIAGSYEDSSGRSQTLVDNETNGTWGTAAEVPGTATLNAGGTAEAFSVSCPSAGNCTVGGEYTDSSGHLQAFTADETSGTWGSAEEVPGSATLNAGGSAQTSSVSCASAGNCTVGGTYSDSSHSNQAFVAEETNGTWGSAEEVPGSATLNTTGNAHLASVSCASAGNCATVGTYDGGEVFVANETNDTWSNAEELPGTATLNTSASAFINSVSCPSAGNCTTGGSYEDSSEHNQAFVADEVNGTWGSAQELSGSATLNAGGYALVNSVSCASAGDCAVGGSYEDSNSATQAFVDDETESSVVTTSATKTTLAATTASSGLQLTATVTGASGSTGTPAGTVTFTDGSTTVGSAAVGSTGTASVTDHSLPAGANNFTATYAPSSTSPFTGSSGTLTQTYPIALTWVSPGSPAISGTDAVGDTLTANGGTWGPTGVREAYQWYASGTAISGATGTTLALGTAEFGKNITVEVTGFEAGDISVTATSPQTTAIAKGALASATPVITNTAKVGYTLRITTGTWTSGTTFTYQWLANGSKISGATGATLLMGTAEYGKKISVQVTGSATDYNSTTKTSAQTATVAAGSLTAPTPKVYGTLKPGYYLRITLGTWTSGTTLKYQWLANGSKISGATSSSLKLGTAEEGKKISVEVTGSKTDYTTITRTSAQTGTIAK